MKKALSILFVVALIVTMVTGCGGGTQQGQGEQSGDNSQNAKDDIMKVAFVYHGVVGDFGWFYGHDKAREKVEEQLDWVKTQKIENVKPGTDAERVFNDLCADGYKVIVAASLDYEEDCHKVAAKYPDVAFLVCSGSNAGPGVEVFFPRRDQLWYILGQIAAGVSKTGKLGLVGSIPNQPTIDSIVNSWALGARSVNPDAEVRVIWVNSFDNPAAERDAALSLIDVGCDVIAQGTNNAAHVQAAEEKGVYAMSQWEDMSSYGPSSYLIGETFAWEKYYVDVFQKIKNGEWEARVYYPPYSQGVAVETKFYQDVPDEVMKRYEETKAALLKDPMLMWEGPIYDNKGNLKIKEGERLPEDDVYKIDWLVQGVISSSK